MNWKDILNNTDPQEMKARLSLAAVVQANGVAVRASGERLVGLCPFHDDHDASFAIWRSEEGDELCGCWSCDFRPGDVYTFLQRIKGITFGQALDLVAEYLANGLPEAPAIPDRVADPEAPARIRSAVESTEGNSIDLLAELLIDKGHPATAEWVASEFRVGTTGRGEVVIPHFSRSGDLDAAKWRTLDRKPISYSGSQLTAMYGEWRDRGRDEIVVCEGESDTWAVAWLLRHEDVDVIGVPSGVTSKPRPEWVDPLKRRNVTILFDADPAGRRGAEAWVKSLKSVAGVVRVAMLPEGEDAVSAGQDDVADALVDAWPVIEPVAGLARTGNLYSRENSNESVVPFSDFVLDVRSVVSTPAGGTVFEVDVPGYRSGPFQLRSSTITDPNRMTRWAESSFRGAWKGGRRESIELLQLVKADAVAKPRYRGTSVTGLHGNTFVLPDKVIGPAGWAFVEPEQDANFGKRLGIHDVEWDRRVLRGLRDLHQADVISPLLGWVAAAPLRSMCPQFPIMALVGGAGWGKTTIVQTVLSAFGFWVTQPDTLSSMTPFALALMAGSTNAFPVWIDEYRNGARKETKQFLDQMIRDAWDGSSGHKGSVGASGRLELVSYTASSPLLVTGEEGFTETSHAERMVILPMPMEGRDPEALALVHSTSSPGLGHAYLSWLVGLLRRDEMPAPPAELGRHEQAIAVVRWGWSLLRQFAAELGVDMGGLDISRADREYEDMGGIQPYEQALREGFNVLGPDGQMLVWADGGDICFRLQSLVKHISQNTDITLPGKSRAMQAWLGARWPLTRDRDGSLRTIRLHGAAAYIAGE